MVLVWLGAVPSRLLASASGVGSVHRALHGPPFLRRLPGEMGHRGPSSPMDSAYAGGLLRLPGCWYGAQPRRRRCERRRHGPRRGVLIRRGRPGACARRRSVGCILAGARLGLPARRLDRAGGSWADEAREYRLGSTRMAGVYSAAKKKEWEKIEAHCPLEAVSSRLWSVASRPPGAWSVNR